MPTEPASGLALLREPFPDHQIGKLPRNVKKDDNDKGVCERGTRYSADGYFCGKWHARSIHLDYVGHAALTDRLLTADPGWSWEPVAFDQTGLPALDPNGGLWIRLTICGTTRLGYGDAAGKRGGDAVKEAIGDALRNAAMRFGAALDLWHKGDLHAEEAAETTPAEPLADAALLAAKARVWKEAKALGIDTAEKVRADFTRRYGTHFADADLTAFQTYEADLTAEQAAA